MLTIHVLPSRRSKFNQANRFIEVLAEAVRDESSVRRLNVVDLCCGKAYLSILAHNYFSNCGYAVNTVGVDLKPDVVSACNVIVTQAQLGNINFVNGDISRFEPPAPDVDVVMSLHACNTATDMVLFNAIRWRARVILCSPCCHHELAHSFKTGYLPEITRYPLLKQRFCELATDAIRANILRAFGYTVQIMEFVDKEDSHKNSLIKAVRSDLRSVADSSIRQKLEAVDKFSGAIGEDILLRRLVNSLPENNDGAFQQRG